MDASTFEILATIIGVVAVFEFFHIGYLVSAIRKESQKHTKLTILSSGILIGKIGDMYTPYGSDGYAISNEGTVRLLGEKWKCVSAEKIKPPARVRVVSVDWNAITVEAVEP